MAFEVKILMENFRVRCNYKITKAKIDEEIAYAEQRGGFEEYVEELKKIEN